jgi:hypothetical protein
MSEHSGVEPLSLEDQFRRQGIPLVLCPTLCPTLWWMRISCSSGCPKCHGSHPGCKRSPAREVREAIMSKIARHKKEHSDFMMNGSILFFISQMGYLRFHSYGRAMYQRICMSPTQITLMGFKSLHSRMIEHTKNICKMPFSVENEVERLYRIASLGHQNSSTLTKAQYDFICGWDDGTFNPVLPKFAWKRILMISISLSFVIGRFVPDNSHFRLSIFHRVLNETAVRRGKGPILKKPDSSHLKDIGLLKEDITGKVLISFY